MATSTADTPTTAGTPEVSASTALEPGGEVLAQPSSHAPARVELALTNQTNDIVSVLPVSFGTVPFEVVQPLTGETGDVWLIPPDNPNVTVMGGKLPAEPEGECWKVVDAEESDELTPYFSSVNYSEDGIDIPAGETYSVQHEVYYRGPDDACFPAGDYQTTARVELRDANLGSRMAVTYVLSVSEDGEFTLSIVSVEDSTDKNG